MFNNDLTRHLTELSKLSMTDEELAKMSADMTDIVALMDKVRDFNGDTEPYTLDAVGYGELRSDEPAPSADTKDIISNAKRLRGSSFAVPRVV